MILSIRVSFTVEIILLQSQSQLWITFEDENWPGRTEQGLGPEHYTVSKDKHSNQIAETYLVHLDLETEITIKISFSIQSRQSSQNKFSIAAEGALSPSYVANKASLGDLLWRGWNHSHLQPLSRNNDLKVVKVKLSTHPSSLWELQTWSSPALQHSLKTRWEF